MLFSSHLHSSHFPSLPTKLKGSLDSLYFVFLQSIFYLLLLETAHCKVINYPPIAETNDHLPVWFCTLALGCCSQLLWETVLRRLGWLPSSGSPPCLQLLLGLASVVSPGLETQLPPWLSSASSLFPCTFYSADHVGRESDTAEHSTVHQVLWPQPYALWLALRGK